MLNAQEIYNKVKAHLLKQKERSVMLSNMSGCAYRNEKGQACAIGGLILDEHYTSEFEGISVCLPDERLQAPGQYAKARLLRDALALSGVNLEEHLLLLKDLQLVHDQNNPETWEGLLEKVAVQHSLEP